MRRVQFGIVVLALVLARPVRAQGSTVVTTRITNESTCEAKITATQGGMNLGIYRLSAGQEKSVTLDARFGSARPVVFNVRACAEEYTLPPMAPTEVLKLRIGSTPAFSSVYRP